MAAAFLNSWLCSPCLYQYFFLIVPLAPVPLNFSLVLAVSPPCRALSWKGHHLWLVLRLRAQIAWPLGPCPSLAALLTGMCPSAGGCSHCLLVVSEHSGLSRASPLSLCCVLCTCWARVPRTVLTVLCPYVFLFQASCHNAFSSLLVLPVDHRLLLLLLLSLLYYILWDALGRFKN